MRIKDRAVMLQTERVSLIRRGLAAIIDMYIASVLANIPILYIYSIETGETQMTKAISELSRSSGILAAVLGIIIILAYYILIPTLKYNGQTLMKRLFSLKVVKTNNEQVDIKTMLKREALGAMIVEGGLVSSGDYLRQLWLILTQSYTSYEIWVKISFAITILSIIVTAFSKHNRAIHDYIANTKVIDLKE